MSGNTAEHIPAFLKRKAIDAAPEPLIKDKEQDNVETNKEVDDSPQIALFRQMKRNSPRGTKPKFIANQPTVAIEKGNFVLYLSSPLTSASPFAVPDECFSVQLNKEGAKEMQRALGEYLK